MPNPKTIILKGDPIHKEAQAGEVLTPGHLLDFAPTGVNQGKLIKHAGAAAAAQGMFAIEESFVGDDITDTYAFGDTVQYIVGRKGDEVYAWLKAGVSVIPGSKLESDGAGALQALTSNFPVAQSKEAKASTGALQRLRVEVL